ncbi:hypothetical protein TPA0910_87430 [Streptomyces hygroscopicus subsp. sporocinereus]|uniref:Uncharacterized protein n=1 Tax=Streptomyces hygroscopicus TaxID=1912 RepID=A0ABQ3UFD8_STRHY|nr:hypothetical protein [Streptomyces hygroscopicus]GHJ34310.1 hypothetical protein TPA0910_87430 [Streptomyces hygroscopicus]
MTHQDDTLDTTDETPQRPGAAQMISNALRALHIDPNGGGAIERPAIAAGRLLAAAEILARTTVSVPGDPDGQQSTDDLMHGFYETVVAFSAGMPDSTSSALRGALLEDRLRRAEKQASLTGEEADQLSAALSIALAETRRLRTKGGVL